MLFIRDNQGLVIRDYFSVIGKRYGSNSHVYYKMYSKFIRLVFGRGFTNVDYGSRLCRTSNSVRVIRKCVRLPKVTTLPVPLTTIPTTSLSSLSRLSVNPILFTSPLLLSHRSEDYVSFNLTKSRKVLRKFNTS